MSGNTDAPNVVIHPPIALGMAIVFAFAADWVYPLPFLPPGIAHIELGLIIIVGAFLLVRWAVQTFRRAKTNLLTNQATLAIVSTGPFAYSRNPIYVGALVGLFGFAVAANSLWFLAALVVVFLVLQFGVIAREESYLTHKFGQTYLDYKSKVRTWL
jgi:protein-S-isoprenylcysteine O-methyltransferase Ste14